MFSGLQMARKLDILREVSWLVIFHAKKISRNYAGKSNRFYHVKIMVFAQGNLDRFFSAPPKSTKSVKIAQENMAIEYDLFGRRKDNVMLR